jgi:uncharacterized Zn-finger protein
MDAVKVCEACYDFLEEIEALVGKSQAVQQLFESLQKKESTGTLMVEDINKVRIIHGFEEILENSEEFLNETDDALDEIQDYAEDNVKVEDIECMDYEEVIYEDAESIQALEEIQPSNVEHEEDDSSNKTVPELTKQSSMEKMSNDIDSFNFVCHICEEVFEQMYSLSNHTREVHQTLPKVACSCGRYLSTWDSLMAHKRKHNPAAKSFACDFCDLSFRTKTGLSIHTKFKHEKPSKPNSCETCGRIFKDGNTLKHHLRTHLSDEEKYAHECPICGKKVVNKYSLQHHIDSIHKGEKKHFCHLCGKKFGNKSNLRSHLISHTSETVICKICGGKFKNLISLQSHKKLHKLEARSFSCEHCEKTFYNQNHLSRHMSVHTEEKIFKCKNCDNEYKCERDLKNHINGVHSGEIQIEDPRKCNFIIKLAF